MTAADVAKRCSCGPCRKQVERAAEQYATERAMVLLRAVERIAAGDGGASVAKLALEAWGRKHEA
jgi:hypothetical protein